MGIGDLTKQLALDAFSNSGKEAEPSKPPDLQSVLLAQVQALQRALKDDEELLVQVNTGVENIRVLEFYTPSADVVMMTGIDRERATTRAIMPTASLQLSVKTIKASPKPLRIAFRAPKGRD